MHNVLVTGGSRGIGVAISRRIAKAGYKAIAVARRESDELKNAIREIAEGGTGGLHFRAFDLSEIDAIGQPDQCDVWMPGQKLRQRWQRCGADTEWCLSVDRKFSQPRARR